MSEPKNSGKGKRKGRGSGKNGTFPEFPSDVKILITVMDKNIQDIRTFCEKNTFG